MNNKEQTAVEWFFMTMNICGLLPTEEIVEYYNQAKEMEKEKQQYFFDCGRQYQLTGEGTFKQVYNETYEDKKW